MKLDSYPGISEYDQLKLLELGVLAGSTSLSEDHEDSDIDIIIRDEQLPDYLYELAGDQTNVEYTMDNRIQAGLLWYSVKFLVYSTGKTINLLVCVNDTSYRAWCLAAEGAILTKKWYPEAFGDKAFRIGIYEEFFKLHKKIQDYSKEVLIEKIS